MSDEPPYHTSESAERDLVTRLGDEYKILQDKIDKIGAFRFTIKGWSVTVIIASIFAGSATKTVPGWLWAISLIGFLIVFFLFERQQTNLRYRFGQRLLDIEAVLSRLLRNTARESRNESVISSFLTLHFVPGIGHHIRDRRARRRGPRTLWQSLVEADVAFYFAQGLVVLAFLFWRGAALPQDRPNLDIVINAFPESTAVTQKPDQIQPSQSSAKETKKTASPLGSDGKKTKKKKEHESN